MRVPWIAPLREALACEFANAPVIAMLATVDREGRARVRCVVVRRLNDDGTLVIATDARSGKACQARHHPMVELAFWLPKQRLQFRLSAAARCVSPTDDDSLRLELWRALPDETRATFFWPPPGRPREHEERSLALGVSADVEAPIDFEALVFEVESVDRLDVAAFPHRRTRWIADGAWQEVELNP